MRKDKIFVIAAGLDESFKRYCPSYDITLFPEFTAFEEYVSTTPDKIHSIVVTSDTLPFTGPNMQRLENALNSPFLNITDKTIYLYDMQTTKAAVRQWIDNRPGFDIVTYQGDLTDQYIIGIVNGKLRDSDEEKVEEVTYRYRASEYVQEQKQKRYETDNNAHYVSDEEEIAGITHVDEPEIYMPTNTEPMKEFPIVGIPGQARTMLAFIEAQYLSLSAKTMIIEADMKFHRLTDIVLKSGIPHLYIDVADVYMDISATIEKIKKAKDNLIVVGYRGTAEYSYGFIKTVLTDTLKDFVQYVVLECDFDETPYMGEYTIVFDDTMPDLLNTVQQMIYPVDPTKNVFVGIRWSNYQPYNITTDELRDVICDLFGLTDVVAQTITLRGSVLKKENSIYDLFSIIGRGNRR